MTKFLWGKTDMIKKIEQIWGNGQGIADKTSFPRRIPHLKFYKAFYSPPCWKKPEKSVIQTCM